MRTSKHKAVLADAIEIEVSSDEACFDATLERLSLNGEGGGHLQLPERPNSHSPNSPELVPILCPLVTLPCGPTCQPPRFSHTLLPPIV